MCCHTTTMRIFLEGQTSNIGTSDYMAARGAPPIPRSPSYSKPSNFMGYILDDLNKIQEAFNHSSNVVVHATISNGDGTVHGFKLLQALTPTIITMEIWL